MKKPVTQKIKKTSAKTVNFIVILGGGMVKDKKTGVWRSANYSESDNFGVVGGCLRVVAGALLFKHRPNTLIIAAGGQGQYKKNKNAPTLASIIKRELITLGVPSSMIIKEEKSGSTYGQLLKLADYIHQHKKFNQVIIISDSWHLPRIKAMLQFAPALQKLSKSVKIKLTSAEDICLKYDKNKWQKIISTAYNSTAMKQRIALEKKGVKDIKQGKYKFKI